MDATVKYENCEELYPGMTTTAGVGDNNYEAIHIVETAPAEQLKRSFSGTEAIGATPNGTSFHFPHYQMQNRNYHGSFGTPNYTPRLVSPIGPEGAGKRYRKNTDHVATIFRAPFFEMVHEDNDTGKLGIVTARCRSCNVVLRGQKNVSSNFIKHMKRSHPETYKVYENIKVLRRGRAKDQQSTDIEQAYLDASTLLEHLKDNIMTTASANEEEQHCEQTEEHSRSTLATTPPNSTETSGTPERSQNTERALPISSIVNIPAITVPQVGLQNEEHMRVELTSQTLECVSRMLDEKLKNCVSKAEFYESTKMLANLMEQRCERRREEEHSLTNQESNTSSKCLNSQMNALQQECRELRVAMQQTQRGKRQLQQELNAVYKALHRHKLIIRHLPMAETQEPRAAVEQLLRDRIELPDISLRGVKVLGCEHSFKNKRHNLLVELSEESDAQRIFKNCHKLQNTGIFIEPNLSPWARKCRSKLLVLRKELLRRQMSLKVHVRDTALLVAGKRFYWDDVEGLCIDEQPAAEETPNAVGYLKMLTGEDLSEFLNILKHYDVQMR